MASSLSASSILTLQNDLHGVLGVPKEATHDDIRRAYRRRALLFHPDKHVGAENHDEISEAFRAVQRAQEILLHPEKRRHYELGGMEDVNRFESNGERSLPSLTDILVAISLMLTFFHTREGFQNMKRSGEAPRPRPPVGSKEDRAQNRKEFARSRQFSFTVMRRAFVATAVLLVAVAVAGFTGPVLRDVRCTGVVTCLTALLDAPIVRRDAARRLHRVPHAPASWVMMAEGGDCSAAVAHPEAFFAMHYTGLSLDGTSAQRLLAASPALFSPAAVRGAPSGVSLVPIPVCGMTVPVADASGRLVYTVAGTDASTTAINPAVVAAAVRALCPNEDALVAASSMRVGSVLEGSKIALHANRTSVQGRRRRRQSLRRVTKRLANADPEQQLVPSQLCRQRSSAYPAS